MQFYSYVTDNPFADGQSDEPIGSAGRSIDRNYKTLSGLIRSLKKAWPGKSFKVFSFTNFHDERTFRLVHREVR
jgi:hypothetical protein